MILLFTFAFALRHLRCTLRCDVTFGYAFTFTLIARVAVTFLLFIYHVTGGGVRWFAVDFTGGDFVWCHVYVDVTRYELIAGCYVTLI